MRSTRCIVLNHAPSSHRSTSSPSISTFGPLPSLSLDVALSLWNFPVFRTRCYRQLVQLPPTPARNQIKRKHALVRFLRKGISGHSNISHTAFTVILVIGYGSRVARTRNRGVQPLLNLWTLCHTTIGTLQHPVQNNNPNVILMLYKTIAL